MLNLDQVHTFLTVAGHLHVGKAAEELYVSQSAVSASITKLETQVGLPLFHRLGPQVQLTEAGSLFRREGQRLIDNAFAQVLELEGVHSQQRGSLDLDASFTVGNDWAGQSSGPLSPPLSRH